jgi:PQQ-dependent dehydrogenase (methanol/ethanol family)
MSKHGLHAGHIATLAGIALAAIGTGAMAQVETRGHVDDQRLLASNDPSDANWITFGRDYRNQRFSSLTSIDTANVGRLQLAWMYQSGIVGSHQTHPLVVDGVMYFTTPACDVVAADAATGDEIWRYRHKFTSPRTGASNRGAAVAYGKVYEATDDHRVIALDQATGKVVFDKLVPGFQPPASLGQPGKPMPTDITFTFRAAPLVYQGKVIVTAAAFSGGPGATDDYVQAKLQTGEDVGAALIQDNLGRRGFIAALDAETGDERWRFYTTKEDGWEGNYTATAPDGTSLNRDISAEKALAGVYKNAWAAGSSIGHFTPALDPASGLLFIGTANPSDAALPLSRPGDNLYSNGILALEADTGALRWFFQAVPHGGNHDVISQVTLFDAVIDGRTVAAAGAGAKTGFYYVVERATGQFLFQSEAFVRQMNLFAPENEAGMLVAPGEAGGVSVSPTSYDPNTGYVYVAAIDRPNTQVAVPLPASASRPPLSYIRSTAVPLSAASGTLTAIDTRNRGKIVWQVRTREPLVGGVLATAGGLVFIGEANGHFDAFDAATGGQLWSFQTGANVGASVMSYAVDGRQFVAVATGAAAPAEGVPIAPGALRPGGAVLAFALPK